METNEIPIERCQSCRFSLFSESAIVNSSDEIIIWESKSFSCDFISKYFDMYPCPEVFVVPKADFETGIVKNCPLLKIPSEKLFDILL